MSHHAELPDQSYCFLFLFQAIDKTCFWKWKARRKMIKNNFLYANKYEIFTAFIYFLIYGFLLASLLLPFLVLFLSILIALAQ